MAGFELEFKMDNAAFEGCQEEKAEAAANILSKISDLLLDGRTGGLIHDVNGNRIGDWGMDTDE